MKDSELLAIILRTGSQRANAISTAENLLSRHGGLDGVFRATIQELCAQVGLGEAKAIQVKAAFEIGRRLVSARPGEARQVRSPGDVADMLMPRMGLLEQEYLNVVLLNQKNRVLDVVEVCRGSLNSAAVRVGEIYREPIRRNAASVILVHNHPSGDPTPSPEDVRLTEVAGEAGRLLDLELLDHVVIGRHGFVSLRERGLGFNGAR